jgi:hypothetical protein
MESWVLPSILLGLIVAGNSVMLWKLSNHYNRLTNKINKKDLLEALNQLLKESDANRLSSKALEKRLSGDEVGGLNNLRKVGFKRFNPFADTGGNQSFCLAVLDANDNGFMISSLHSRENTRLYAKVIAKGQSVEQNLSKEEREVLEAALKQP